MTFYHGFTTPQQKDSYHIIIGKRKCNGTYKTNFLYNVIIPIRLSDLIQHETQIMFHHNVKNENNGYNMIFISFLHVIMN